MLLISELDQVALPKKYHAINNLCAVIYDQLTDLLANDAYDPYFKHTSFINSEDLQLSFEELKNGNIHVFDWLAENKMNDELSAALTKHITLSILSDLVNFLYESLNCAKKGKIAVAYALLRKPFTDELLLLEQLLSDKEEFIQRFFHEGDPKKYDPSSKEVKRNQTERVIIENAIKKLSLDNFFNAGIIYALRYDKSSANGINGISNKALHIVTSDQNYKTLNQNLNFIFSSGPLEYEKHCEHYYYFVPLLLLYTAAIADEILFQFLPLKEHQTNKVLRAFRRFVGYGILNKKPGEETLLDVLGKVIQYDCDKCNSVTNLNKDDFELFFNTSLFLCRQCFTPFEINEETVTPLKDLLKLMDSQSLYTA